MKIPTISELLDSPQLKPWVDRASRNVMMTNVKTFVTRMSADLQTRAAEMKVPTVSELADRIAQWVSRRQAGSPHAVINATGILFPPDVVIPLADEALHSLHASLRDYVAESRSGNAVSAGQQVVADLARQLTAAEACVVTHSHSSAMLLVLSTLSTGGPIVVARGHVTEIEPGTTLPQIARVAGASLRECGIAERATLHDYEESIGGAGAILMVANPRAEQPLALLSEVAALAKRSNVPLIVELGLGGIVDVARYGLADVPHAAAVLSQGADLVIMSGDRFLGGPPAGVILGREAAIDRLRKAGLFTPLTASSLTLLPLAATMELHQDLETAERTVPILSLASTSLDNLKHRADRLAAQLSGMPQVASATAHLGEAFVQSRGFAGKRIESWEVQVELRDRSPESILQSFAAAPAPILATVANGKLVLNLRTVLARHDMHLVDAFEALFAEAQEQSSTSPEAK